MGSTLLQSHLTIKPKYYCSHRSLTASVVHHLQGHLPPLSWKGLELSWNRILGHHCPPPPALLSSAALFLQVLLAIMFCQTITQQLFIFSILPLKDGKLSEILCSFVLVRKKINFPCARPKEYVERYWKIACANLCGPDPHLLHRATPGDSWWGPCSCPAVSPGE